jgi:hypothetical protein
MTIERFGIVKFRGQDVTVSGADLRPDPAAAACVPALGEEPNYAEVSAAAKAAL